MARAETNVTNRAMLRLSPKGFILWKNVRGMFWTLDKKRKIKAGLQADGSSDLIGGEKVVITPEMVGQTILVFTALEVKTEDGTVQKNQSDYLASIKKAGGNTGIIRGDTITINRPYLSRRAHLKPQSEGSGTSQP